MLNLCQSHHHHFHLGVTGAFQTDPHPQTLMAHKVWICSLISFWKTDPGVHHHQSGSVPFSLVCWACSAATSYCCLEVASSPPRSSAACESPHGCFLAVGHSSRIPTVPAGAVAGSSRSAGASGCRLWQRCRTRCRISSISYNSRA